MESFFSRRNLLLSIFITWLMLLLSSSSKAYTSNNGNITVKWDLRSWTTDGYVAAVTIYNHQKDRSICDPGWTLGWRWTHKEVIWSMVGAEATEKGDCSRFNQHNIPHSCVKNPRVVDLLPGVPYNQKTANCCKGGVLEGETTTSAFRISVGNAGTTVETVMMPVKFVFLAPKQRYVCGPTTNVEPTIFVSSGERKRTTKALLTWNVVCVFHEETSMSCPSF